MSRPSGRLEQPVVSAARRPSAPPRSRRRGHGPCESTPADRPGRARRFPSPPPRAPRAREAAGNGSKPLSWVDLRHEPEGRGHPRRGQRPAEVDSSMSRPFRPLPIGSPGDRECRSVAAVDQPSQLIDVTAAGRAYFHLHFAYRVLGDVHRELRGWPAIRSPRLELGG